MLIKELSSCLAAARLYGDGDVEISDLQADSRKVGPGDLFICLPGHTVDGHDYAPQAAAKGAAALVCERKLDIDLPQIVVDDCRYAMSVLSNAFFSSPSSRMKLIGITGTNGKTTTTYLIERIMQDHGVKTGLIGTIQMRYDGQSYPMSGTTQESLELQRSLNHMALKGVQCCVMEVSSHALQQGAGERDRLPHSDFYESVPGSSGLPPYDGGIPRSEGLVLLAARQRDLPVEGRTQICRAECRR